MEKHSGERFMIRKLLRIGLIAWVVVGMLFSGGMAFAETEITTSLKSTIDEVITIVKDEKLKDQQEKASEQNPRSD